MFISVIKRMVPYVIIAVLCFIISIVYEQFSHGVTSIYMVYAFLIPLLAGIIILLIGRILNRTIYRAAWITLLFYSYMRGVIEIFGTTSVYLNIYLYASIVLMLLSMAIKESKKKSR